MLMAAFKQHGKGASVAAILYHWHRLSLIHLPGGGGGNRQLSPVY